MGEVQVCPVCGKGQILGELDQCPQCNADLACFRALDRLPEQWSSSHQGRLSGIIALASLISIIIVLILVVWTGYQTFRVSKLVRANQKRLAKDSLTLTTLMEKVESYQDLLGNIQGRVKESLKVIESRKNEVLNKEEERPNRKGEILNKGEGKGEEEIPMEGQSPGETLPEYFWYETKDTDTLWGISQHFYKDGRYYPVLMAMNPDISIYSLKGAQRLRIIKDARQVPCFFYRYVEQQGRTVYFWYTIRERESLRALSQRFYKTEDKGHLIQGANPDLSLIQGQRIRILLSDIKGFPAR